MPSASLADSMDEETYLKVGKALADMLDLLEQSPGAWVPSCTCGWRGAEWDNEADSEAEMRAHQPCYRPFRTTCECGWASEDFNEEDGAWAEWDRHCAAAHAGVAQRPRPPLRLRDA